MRVLVTGCQGTIGRRLVPALREGEGAPEVFGCDLQHHRDASYMRADVADYRELAAVIEVAQPDVVYHLAAEFGRHNGEDYYGHVWRTNVIGTRNLLELQTRAGFRLVFASSSEVYGELHEDPIREDASERIPLRQHNDYAISKWVNERQIQNFEERHGIEVMRLRFFNAYGYEDFHPYRSVVCLFAHAALTGEPLTVFRGYHRTFMHMDDFVPSLARAWRPEHFMAGTAVNLGGREYRPVEDVALIACETAGRDPERAIVWVGEDEHNVRSKRPDITRAEKLLLHDPRIALEEGVPQTVRWMAQRYGLELPKEAAAA